MSERNLRSKVGSPMRWATDLQLLLVSLVLIWGVTLLPVVRETPIRIVVALLVALFVPGYALIAALFPECGPPVSKETAVPPTEAGSDTQPSGIDVLERLVLSFGASIAVVPLVGLVLNFTPWGLRLVPILVGLTIVTVLLTILAAVRRTRLPSEEQFDPRPVRWLVSELRGLAAPEDRTDALLNVLLVVSVLLAVGSVAYAVSDPAPEEEFTEFYLLTENETGDLVAANYPTNFTTGESQSIVVGIGNEEGGQERYTVVTQLQAVEIGDGTVAVTDARELDRFSRELSDGASVNLTREITPRELTGERLRVQFLLYRGQVPDTPDPSSAYRETHLWVNVTAADPA
jgi:uncharacterized membrane protein